MFNVAEKPVALYMLYVPDFLQVNSAWYKLKNHVCSF